MLRVAQLLCVFLTLSTLAQAHDPGLSSVNLVVSSGGIELTGTFAASDARWLKSEDSTSDTLNAAAFPANLQQLSRTFWIVKRQGVVLSPINTQVEATAGNNIEIKQEFAGAVVGELVISANVFELLPPGHREHATITRFPDHLVATKLFSSRNHEISYVFKASAPTTAGTAVESSADTVSFTAFLKLGIEHILTGYDHLLFLFAFLITARGIKPILKIITSFTVAHSITLGLSALNIVYIPSRVIEPLIAATIVFVALQNLFRRDRLGERAALTFAFGLIHGFGFAAVLRDMGIASLGSSAWRALAGFNLGVEAGQIAVAALVLPLLWLIRTRPLSQRSWMPATSAVIAAAGVFWFIQRVSGA